eukprot:5972802-Amphidinium_carterae.1
MRAEAVCSNVNSACARLGRMRAAVNQGLKPNQMFRPSGVQVLYFLSGSGTAVMHLGRDLATFP